VSKIPLFSASGRGGRPLISPCVCSCEKGRWVNARQYVLACGKGECAQQRMDIHVLALSRPVSGAGISKRPQKPPRASSLHKIDGAKNLRGADLMQAEKARKGACLVDTQQRKHWSLVAHTDDRLVGTALCFSASAWHAFGVASRWS